MRISVMRGSRNAACSAAVRRYDHQCLARLSVLGQWQSDGIFTCVLSCSGSRNAALSAAYSNVGFFPAQLSTMAAGLLPYQLHTAMCEFSAQLSTPRWNVSAVQFPF